MKTWSNSIKSYTAYPSKIVKVKSIHDIQYAIKEAEAIGERVRAVGSGHSFSDVAIVPKNGIMLDMMKLDFFKLYNQNQRKPEFQQSHLVEVGAGLTIKKFNKQLDKHDLAITNMGGIDHQTLSGAVSTGTHGTGIGLPAISGMVRSMVLVGDEGKVFRIEPKSGITLSHYRENDIELIQDDEVFNSVLIGLGCMGIIFSMVLEVEPMYWLKEVKTVMDWAQLKPRIADKSVHEGFRGVMMQMNPYKREEDGGRTCVLVEHSLIDPPTDGRTINESTRNWLSSLGSNPITYAYLLHRINKKPEKMRNMLNTSLKSLKDKVYINRGHRVLYQGVEYIKERAYDSEFAFDLEKGAYLDAIEELFDCAEEIGTSRGIYQTSPIGFRFVKKSTAYLTPEYDKDVCYIDTPFLVKTRGAEELLGKYQEIMMKYGGIPHWGKINSVLNPDPKQIEKLYPKLEVWRKIFHRFNSKGTFSNKFSDRLMLGGEAEALEA